MRCWYPLMAKCGCLKLLPVLFWPKYAVSGRTWPKSFAQTVVTPRKCPGRALPSQFSAGPATTTVVNSPGGYMVATSGIHTAWQPPASSLARSPASSRGYLARSSFGPNCNGLTKIEATTPAPDAAAACTSASWPACSEPIVGTSATAPKRPRSSEQAGPRWARSRETCMRRSIARQNGSRNAQSGCWCCRHELS